MCAWLLTEWATSDALAVPRSLGWWMVAACLTRYEAWPIVGALVLAGAAGAMASRHAALRALVPAFWQLARYPIGAAMFFLFLSRATVGEWFVSGGFYVPDPDAAGPARPWCGRRCSKGRGSLAGAWLVRLALVAVAAAGPRRPPLAAGRGAAGAARRCSRRRALPFSAYLSGHPFRIRYEIPLVVASCPGRSASAWAWRDARRRSWHWSSVLLVGREAPPFDADRADDRARRSSIASNGIGRQAVTDLPGARLPRRDHLRQHGLARALHAGAVGASASASATSCTKATTRCGTSAIVERRRPVRGLDAGRGGGGGRRRASRSRSAPTRRSPTATSACARAATSRSTGAFA